VLSNHQSWVDIPTLQKTFNRRIPFLKFFLQAATDLGARDRPRLVGARFPLHSAANTKQQLEQHPDGAARTRRPRASCERFRTLPVSVMNFVEGTRFTPAKHAKQESPYANLLPAPAPAASPSCWRRWGDMLQSIIDVTIVYPNGQPTLIDLLANRITEIRVHVRQLPIPSEFVGGDYEGDAEFRGRFQNWMSWLWAEKDALIDRMRRSHS